MNGQQSCPPVLLRAQGRGADRPWDSAVIIPARDESNRIEACLHALAEAIAKVGRGAGEVRHQVGVIVIVNDTTDNTASKAASVLRARALAHLVFDLRFAPGTGGVGRARDLGMSIAQCFPHPPRMLMSTDADSRVSRGWIVANLAALQGADVVFGTVIPDPDEFALIRPLLPRHSAAERRYSRAAVRLAARLDPLPHDPAPRHRNRSGASIALTAQALARLGGIPWQPLSEDRALALKAEALDLRIRHALAPQVVTSCRLEGRAEGGMAATLRTRCATADPFCDDWLEPVARLVRRYDAKGRLRALWPAPAAVWSVARQLLGPVPGIQPVPRPDSFTTFGTLWQHLEATHPALARHPMRQSDAARELPLLLARLRQIDSTVAGEGAIPGQQDALHAPSAP